MRSGGKGCWKTILLETQGGGDDGALSRPNRLAALYRFQNGEALSDVRLIDPHRQVEVLDPAEIDWTHFPVVEALEAVTREELNRLRSLLRAGQQSSELAPTAPDELVWGVELHTAAKHDSDGATKA